MSNLDQVNVNGTLYGLTPSDAITKAQLDQSVQASLDKADTALQQTDVDAALSDSSTNPVQNKVMTAALDTKATVIIDTASGAIASFPDGADNVPMKDVVCEINPLQDLHGYDYPWPAGGGKNLLPPYSRPSVTDQGVTLTNNNGEYMLNGTTGSLLAVFDVRVNLPAGQYTVALNNPTANNKVQIYGIDENAAVPMQVLCSTANTTATVTFEATVTIFRIRVLANATVSNFKLSPVFSAGATAATQFYPYENLCPISGFTGLTLYRSGEDTSSPDTYTISWQTEAGTVYCGTINLTTGVLTVKWAMMTVNGSTSLQPNGVTANTSRFGLYVTGKANGETNVLSNLFTYRLGPDTIGNIEGRDGNNFVEFSLQPDVAQTVAAGQAWFADNPTQLVYELATPIVYDLTPTEVTTLLAQNNFWHDANGDTNATYRADTALYIDKKLSTITAMLTAYVEASMTASRAYAVNDFVNVNGQLYRVTAPIANGGTITPGTNATATTIGTQLTTIINS